MIINITVTLGMPVLPGVVLVTEIFYFFFFVVVCLRRDYFKHIGDYLERVVYVLADVDDVGKLFHILIIPGKTNIFRFCFCGTVSQTILSSSFHVVGIVLKGQQK